jgi:hypothetical protein
MDCSTIQQKLAEYADGSLIPDDIKQIEKHLASCERCRSYASELSKTIEALKGLDDIPSPPWLAQKIMQKIRTETQPKKGLFQKLFFPLHIKLPLEAFATLLIAGAAVLIMKSIGPDLWTVKSITEKPPVHTLPPEKELLPKDYPKDTLAAGKAGQAPAPAVRPKAEPSSAQPPVPDQEPVPPSQMPAAPAPPAPVTRSFGAGKALDSAEGDETRQKTAPGSAQSGVSAEKKSLDILTVTVQVKDPEKASREIEVVLSKLRGSISSVDKREASTILTIQLDPSRTETFLKQLNRIGSMKVPRSATENSTENNLIIILIKQ